MKLRAAVISLVLPAVCALSAAAQQALVPAGSTNLSPGQYMLTNLNSGQALYVVIDQSGQLYAQDPRLLQFVVQQGQGQMGAPAQQNKGFGGMLKQGLEDLVRTRMTPQGTVPAQ